MALKKQPDLITIRELAQRVGLSRDWLHIRIRRGDLAGSLAPARIGNQYVFTEAQVEPIRRAFGKAPGLTVSEAARYLGVRRQTIYNMVKRGAIVPSFTGDLKRPFAFDQDHLDQYLEAHSHE